MSRVCCRLDTLCSQTITVRQRSTRDGGRSLTFVGGDTQVHQETAEHPSRPCGVIEYMFECSGEWLAQALYARGGHSE